MPSTRNIMSKVVSLEKHKTRRGFGTYKYDWGSAVKDETTGKWITLFIKSKLEREPIHIDLEHHRLNVIVHDNGIEFVEEKLTAY